MSNSILIIDDSPHLHKLVVAHLKADPIVVHSATDGESGLAAATELQPGLILLDVDMPALGGFEVCRQLKAGPATSAIPVMFVTADGTLMDKVRGLDLGAVDYLTKPFKPEELRARVALPCGQSISWRSWPWSMVSRDCGIEPTSTSTCRRNCPW